MDVKLLLLRIPLFGIYWDGGEASLHWEVLVYFGRGAEEVFSKEFGYMLGGGQSIPSLGSLGICWEGGRASLHQGVWVYVGRGAEQVFTREFGYMLGVGWSKPSLGSLGTGWGRGGGANLH